MSSRFGVELCYPSKQTTFIPLIAVLESRSKSSTSGAHSYKLVGFGAQFDCSPWVPSRRQLFLLSSKLHVRLALHSDAVDSKLTGNMTTLVMFLIGANFYVAALSVCIRGTLSVLF